MLSANFVVAENARSHTCVTRDSGVGGVEYVVQEPHWESGAARIVRRGKRSPRATLRGAAGVTCTPARPNVPTEIKQKIQGALKIACEIKLTAFI